MDSMIMPGVTIGEGVVIEACSLVTKDVSAWICYAEDQLSIRMPCNGRLLHKWRAGSHKCMDGA